MKKTNQQGFTFIEIIVSILIAALFIPLAYVAFSNAIREGTKPEDITRARLVAEQAMELAKRRGFTQLNTDIANPGTLPPCTGAESLGVILPAGYSCTWTPSRTNLPSGLPAGQEQNYIRVEVLISTPQGNTFDVSGLVTNHGY